MANNPEYAEKAEKLRDAAAKGVLESIEEMISESLDDIIWWINEGNNVSKAQSALGLRSPRRPLPALAGRATTPNRCPNPSLPPRAYAWSVCCSAGQQRSSWLRCGGT